MKTRNLIRGIAALCLAAGILSSCDSERAETPDTAGPDQPVESSGIVARGISEEGQSPSESTISFTDEQIESFNTVTREIRFRGMEPAEKLTPYRQIVFELDGETLFTAATAVTPANSQIICDLVLYVVFGTDYRYFLYDGYPVWAGETDLGRANAAKRSDGWNRFTDWLKLTGRLTEYDDGGNGDPGTSDGLSLHLPAEVRCHDTGEIPLNRYIPSNEWLWKSDIEHNSLYVLRNESELQALLTPGSYTPSGIDFDTYSLLLVRVSTSNGIEALAYGLNPDARSYTYSLKAYLNDTAECPSYILAVLAPALPGLAQASFSFESTFEYDPDQSTRRNTGPIYLIDFYPEHEWNPYQWKDIEANTLYVIRSEQELETLLENDYTPTGIDFQKYTLLLVKACTNYGIHYIEYGLRSEEERYVYSMLIQLNAACVCPTEAVGVLAPAIPAGTNVAFDFQIGR